MTTSYAHLLTGENVTRALAERIEVARRAPRFGVGCPSCRTNEACSQHIAEQLVEAARQEDLVIMPSAEADAIIRESVRRLTTAGGEATPASPDDAGKRYPSGRPGWLGPDQDWPCSRCKQEVSSGELHDCVASPQPD